MHRHIRDRSRITVCVQCGMASNERPKARIYRRISDDREGREIGVGRQDEAARKLATQLDAEVVGVYTDNDVSASSLSKAPRPDYDRLLADAAGDPGSLILAYSNSRLTRRPAEWEDLIRLYERARVVIHTVASGRANLATADGRGVARTIAAWDAAEAERTSERVAADVVRRAQAGLFHGGSRSFGWKDTQTLDPDEQQVMNDVADRLLAGESLRAVTADLNARGVATVTGAAWSSTVVKQMLVNPRVAGWRIHRGEIVGRAVWPPAMDEAKWRRLVALLTDPGRDLGSRTRVNLLSGLARCGECDRPLSVVYSSSAKQGRRRKYVCKPDRLYRDMQPIDVYVTAAVVRMLEDYRDDPADVDPAVVAAVERLRARIAAVAAEFADDDTMTPQQLRETLRLLRGRLAAEEAKLVSSRRHQVVNGIVGEDAAAAWDALTLDRKRAIIAALVEVRLHRAKPGRNAFNPATVEILAR